MGGTSTATYGVIRYAEPDDSLPASERAFYSFPANKYVKDEKHLLHELRTSIDVQEDGAGLDTQGFTYVRHNSNLGYDDFFEGDNIEKKYAPEMIKLICEVTGAKRAVVDGFALRTRTATEQEEDKHDVQLRGCEGDQWISNLRRDVIRLPGRDRANAVEPARIAHVDYSVKGLRDTVRWSRKDIARAAQSAIEAEDRGEKSRYSMYSIWRPLKPVKRDPLAVLDWRSADPSELASIPTRALSEMNEEGEYVRTGFSHIPPKNPAALRWYWLPNQKSDEVLILKFVDTATDDHDLGNGPAAHCVHAAAVLPGTEDEEARESIECRIIAFFD